MRTPALSQPVVPLARSLAPWSSDSDSVAPPASPGLPSDDPYRALYGYVLQRPRRLEFIKFLGAGAFGCVFLAEDIDWVELPPPPLESPFQLAPAITQVAVPPADTLAPSNVPAPPPAWTSISEFPPPPLKTTLSHAPPLITGAQPYFPPPPSRFYAVKCLDNSLISRAQRLHEMSNHRAVLGHRGILDFFACVQQDGWSFLVLEYAEDGDMFQNMLDTNAYSGDDGRIGDAFAQVVDAVRHCHRKGVFHRDLKPENIMCRKGGTVALGDFGLSTTGTTSMDYGCGSTFYMSPECMAQGYLAYGKRSRRWQPTPFDTSKNDVWSLGIVLVNMICCRGPWEKAAETDPDFMRYLRRPLVLREILPISWATFSILHRIFDANPISRISLPLLKTMLQEIETYRMAPWELEGAGPSARESAEIWLPPGALGSRLQPGKRWTRYETYPEHLDPPCLPVPCECVNPYYPMLDQLNRQGVFEMENQTSVGSQDIVPSLEHDEEEEVGREGLDSAVVTPEALVGVDPGVAAGEECMPELDLADGLDELGIGFSEIDLHKQTDSYSTA